ncbi:MAG TPA: pyridoxamine 5'-phosphate oxidase family protein [Actinomadura sp.]|jgi:uncharacterized pyridoxamine 5'-phosphate oxidase family protein|nr:pyridoxamine 5'-phosphate oxidase family protein [Actinomadura sp.]
MGARVYETPSDLIWLQRMLDDSHARAGAHLRSIITEDRRVDAARLADELRGVQILHLATVTARHEPRVGPVDGLFFHGRFWFGSGPDSARFRHLRARPQVSACVTRGEGFQVTVHGRAVEVDMAAPETKPFRDLLIEVYGDDWESWAGDAPYARIEPTAMFTFGGVDGAA